MQRVLLTHFWFSRIFALVKAKELLQPLLGTTINNFSCASYVQCFLWDLLTYVKTRISPTAPELFMLWYPENGEIVLASISPLSTLKKKKKKTLENKKKGTVEKW